MLSFIDNILRNISSGRINGLYIITGAASCFIVGVVSYRYFFSKKFKSITANKESTSTSTSGTSSPPQTALRKTQYEEFELIKKEPITHNTCLFRFKLPENHVAGIPVGQHISLQVDTGKGKAARSYTPISAVDQKGYFDLAIKYYEKGRVTPIVHSMDLGDKARIRGPSGSFKYNKEHKRIGMLAAGTGITPMWKIIESIVNDETDNTQVNLLFANRTEDDVLFENDLLKFSKDDNVRVNFLFSQPKDPEACKMTGRISKEMIGEHMPQPSQDALILVCGPSGFQKSAISMLKEIGYERSMYHRF
eukprot:gb/GECH01001972.1/.p1 GENE.gb/GECH01001972.1/~~gb/GECH01001972.1/.p1  ORF type:complete len:306 (+),score=75.64 gb/GECH01001972.1/:1-918(+)